MSRTFIDAVAIRRSYYQLSSNAIVDDNIVIGLVDQILATMPSPFNVQSARIVILFGKEHRTLWDIVSDELRAIMPDDKFPNTAKRIDRAFRSGRGTILFYEDSSTLEQLKHAYPTYADKVDIWSEQCSGMHQFAIWTALEDMDYGASIQHYNPLIDGRVSSQWDIPKEWRLITQMPFGSPLDTPSSRIQTSPPDQRRRIYGL